MSTFPNPLPSDSLPKIDHLIFEDGRSIHRVFNKRQQDLLVEPLYASWNGPPESGLFAAFSDVGLFTRLVQTVLVPDAMLTAHIEVPRDQGPRENQSYLAWEYGKPPDAVVEIVSDRRGGELGHKLRDYARIGVGYYAIYDPDRHLDGPELYVYQLSARHFEPLERPWFPDLGIGLTLWQGVYEGVEATWLRWCDADGKVIPTGEERAREAEDRARQAQDEAKRSQDEAKKAVDALERERQEKERLLAHLRSLGIDPPKA